MELGLGEVCNEGPNQHCRFSLSNEWRGCCNHGFSAGHTHRPPEEYGEFADEPLKYAIIEAYLHKGDEEDNCR